MKLKQESVFLATIFQFGPDKNISTWIAMTFYVDIQFLNILLWNLVQTIMFPQGWYVVTFVIPMFYIIYIDLNTHIFIEKFAIA